MPTLLDSPVSPNPSILNPNATSILVKWSPPFLWPGYAIAFYNVSVTNTKGHTDSYHLNTSFSDVVVSFSLIANQSQTIESCDRLRFEVAPITTDDSIMAIQSLVITGGFIPSTQSIDSSSNFMSVFSIYLVTRSLYIHIILICSASVEFMSFSFDVNITVLFTMDRQPVVTLKTNVCSIKHNNIKIIQI